MKILKIMCMLSIFLTASCGSNGKASSDTAVNVTNTTAEEAAIDVFSTPDLSLCDVRGHVKEITSPDGENLEARFDKDGNLLNYGSRDRISNVERDENGRLVAFLGSEWMKVEWEGEVPLTIQNTYNEMTCSDTYTRDSDGKIVKIAYRYQDMIEETDETEIRMVEYGSDSFDTQGNWIKRTIVYPDGEKQIIERKITYFE